jgi:hypothetical protein
VKGFTPPLFLRHVFPWRLLYYVDRHSNTCLSGFVMWKLGYGGWSWWPHAGCWDGPLGEEYDYCAKYESFERFQCAGLGQGR